MKNQDKCLRCGKISLNGYYVNGYCDSCNYSKQMNEAEREIPDYHIREGNPWTCPRKSKRKRKINSPAKD